MLSSNALKTTLLSAAVIFAVLPSHAWAEVPSIQIGGDPALVFGPDALESTDWRTQARQLVAQWLDAHPSRNPVGAKEAEERKEAQHEALEPSDQMSKLVIQVLDFTRSIADQSEEFETYFREQFAHGISESRPGFAWFLVAEQVDFNTYNQGGIRYGGGLGVQVPVLGSQSLWLKEHQSQLMLRMMPIAGDYERVGNGPAVDRHNDPDAGITLRPTAELEATAQVGIAKPGVRFRVEPQVADPTQARMILEVFAEVDVNTGNRLFKTVSIVPRCVFQKFTSAEALLDGHSLEYAGGYARLNDMKLCSVSAEFKLGD